MRALLASIALARHGLAIFVVPDSSRYLGLASNLAAGRGFTDFFGHPEVFRTPGYPLVLSLGTSRPIAFAILINMLCAAAIVIVTYAVARRFVDDERIALACAFVVAIEPTMLAWSLKVMPETLLTLCLVVFVACAFHALEARDVRWTIAAAIAVCIAAYVKPIAYPLVFVILLASLFLRAPRMSIAFALTAALLLAPWHVRNYARTGYAGFTSLLDRALYLSAGGAVVARQEHRSYEEVHEELLLREGLRTDAESRERNARIRHEGVSQIASHPLSFALTQAKGSLRTLLDPGATEYLRFLGVYSSGARASGLRAYPMVLWSSVVLGLLLLPLLVLPLVALRHPTRERMLLALIVAYLVAAGGGIPGYARFRVPAVPMLVLLSAAAVASYGRSGASRGQRDPSPAS
ncbi:MAG TPA: glycosyltransferase family 39 protein [Thermoanaerobaculia bacterium]|nr:glycosyltransferase family 39 protein [Thermoanaerobaculia bacterium]